MRLEVTIPDQLVGHAQRMASEAGVTFDRFVVDAVQLHLEDKLDDQGIVTLTPEQVAIIRKGQADIKAGKGLNREQVEKRLAANKAAWLRENPR